jgi:hypothetical protein
MRKHFIVWIVLGAAALWAASAAATTPRFVPGGDAGESTVVDQEVGLEWAIGDAAATATWVDALSHCDQLDYGGHDDWRLPNIAELTTIVDERRETAPAVNTTFFTSAAFSAGAFWSSTTSPKLASTAYAAWFYDTGDAFAKGGAQNLSKATLRNVLCVRTAD